MYFVKFNAELGLNIVTCIGCPKSNKTKKSLNTYLCHIFTKWTDISTTDKGVDIAHINKGNVIKNCFEIVQLTSTKSYDLSPVIK